MRNRFHIVLSSRHGSTDVDRTLAPSFWTRFKLAFATLALAILAIATLVAALILGYAIAAVLGVLLVIGVAVVIVKTALKRTTR